jgi:CelD/BcsL family acetyltransferase involved in cellulose biosynthesis
MINDTTLHDDGLGYETSTGDRLRVVRLANGRGLDAHRAAWRDLAEAACEANVFYEPWLLEPAIASLRGNSNLEIVLVYEDDGGRTGRLCGLFPLERQAADRRRPLARLALWKHLHCFSCTPLIRAEVGPATLEAFFHWLGHGDVSARWMAFDHVGLDGPFARLLAAELARRGARALQLERFERAFIETSESADVYLRAAMTGKRRREVERHARKLGELGSMQIRVLTPEDGEFLEAWLDEFLTLEASGWKGRDGSAIACRSDEKRFFLAAARGAFASNRLMMLAIDLDGRPIAMKCNFLTPRAFAGGFAYKIAFDEAFGRHSPGVVLEFENLHRIHTEPRLAWMDSCAKADHPMLDRMWRERRVVGDLLVSTGRPGGEVGLRIFDAMRRLKQRGTSARGSEPARTDTETT